MSHASVDSPPAADAVAARPAPTTGTGTLPSPPGWVRLLDIGALLFLYLAFAVLVGDRIRISLGPLRVTIGSVERQLGIAVGLLVLRHWAWRGPALHRRLLDGWRTLWGEPAFRTLTAQYWTIRLAMVLVGYLAAVSFGVQNGGPFRVHENEFLNLPARWDAGWYLGIASDGYRPARADEQQNIAFMPAFPILMRLGGSLLGVDQDRMRVDEDAGDRMRLLWSGLIVSLILGWIGSTWVMRLAAQWMDPERAVGAAILLQAYPFSVFYGAPYTEALFLAGGAAALVLFRRACWTTAMLCGLVVGVARPNGFVLSVPLGLLFLWWVWAHRRREGRLPSIAAAIGPALVPIAPTVAMLAFSWLIYTMTGHPFRWTQLHAAWGREYRSVFTLASGYYDRMLNDGLYHYTSAEPIDALNLAAAIFAVAAIIPVWRRFGLPWAAFLLAIVLPPLSMGGVLSMGRITSTAIPAFLWLALVLSPGTRRNLQAAFIAFQALAAALFFTWRPLF